MGAAVAHFGIRYANDLTGEFGEYIVDFVGLLNSQLASHGMGFFFDAVDVGLPEGLCQGARDKGETEQFAEGQAIILASGVVA